MLAKLLRIVIMVVGFMVGPGIVLAVETIYEHSTGVKLMGVLESWVPIFIYISSSVITGIIFLLLSKRIAGAIEAGVKSIEGTISQTPSGALLSGAIGLVIGLVIAALISVMIGLIQVAWISVPLTIIDYIIFGYLGLTTGVKRRRDLVGYISGKKQLRAESADPTAASPKILDTSVIIDGRILDICKTGVFEGELIVPEFVLGELQKIADSADSMKRTRGRRGLDILQGMQKELKNPVRISRKDYDDVPEVDLKLLRMAKDIDGTVVTNDYNLNKVAVVQDVKIFNINELANAVKPILLAGEELRVTIVRDGKEPKQGVAYLDDGTMIVVEGARGQTDEKVDVVVTSILQTAAGRMIFAKLKDGA